MTNSQLPQHPIQERVAAYVRVSTQEQKLHGLSLDAQRDKLSVYAEVHNMRIVDWYVDEGVSARKLIRKRPELQRMICDAKKGLFTRIIMIKLDRFFRSVAEYHECMKRISPVVWTTTEEDYDLTTAQGRLLVNMKLTIAELEADQTSERIKLVNEYKVKTGQPLWGKHSLPLGFMVGRDPNTGRKNVIHDPAEESIVYDVLDHFMTYQSKHKTSVYMRKKYNISMNYLNLTHFLSNTMLYGTYRDNPSYCEPYIDKATFDRIQEMGERNIKTNTRRNRVYLFSGLIRCPKCGHPLCGGTRIRRRGDVVDEYKRYRCPEFARDEKCSFNKSIHEPTLERMLLDNIEKFFYDYKIEMLGIDNTEKIPNYDIEGIYSEIDRLNYSWQTGKIRTVEQYEKQYSALQTRLADAEQAKRNAPKEDFNRIEELLGCGWKVLYEGLTDENKQAFWRSFIRAIEITWTNNNKQIRAVKFF